MARVLLTAIATLVFNGAANAQDTISIEKARDIASDAKSESIAAIPDLPGTGPYPAIKETVAAFPGHVVFRPRDLDALKGRKLPIVVWGNGGCRDDVAVARLHLLEIASHGYLVVAPGGIYSGPGAVKRGPAKPADGMPAGKTSAVQVAQGIDLAIAANADPANPLYGHVDTDRIAVSGRSCGGLQSLLVAADPRIDTAVVHNSGIFSDTSRPVDGMIIGKEQLKKLHTPVLYILGGPTDAAYRNGMDDFARIDNVPVMLVDMDTGHGGTYRELFGGRTAQIEVDWLDWQLGGDVAAGRSFAGPSCRLCNQPDLRVMKKRIDD